MKTKFNQARKKERETEKDREREVSKLVFYTQSQREGKNTGQMESPLWTKAINPKI